MAQARLPVRKILEVLRLQAAGLKGRQIAAAIGSALSTVQECLRRAREAGVAWPLPDELNEEALHARLYPRAALPRLTGALELDNNAAADRAPRAVALGPKTYLFAGSDAGGERAAALYWLLGTAKLNDLDLEAYLRRALDDRRASGEPRRRAPAGLVRPLVHPIIR